MKRAAFVTVVLVLLWSKGAAHPAAAPQALDDAPALSAPGGTEESHEDELVVPMDGPAMGRRLTQADVESGDMSLRELRREGLRIFSTPFNKHDGYGDGPMDALDPTTPGGRPTMGDNGTFLRVNGLDSQSCLECHAFLSHRTIPPTFAVGGIGGISATAMPMARRVDMTDEAGKGFASYDGRLINPPFLFGSGGVELVAKEMTRNLQARKREAESKPGEVIELVSHGVSFGTIRYDGKHFDTSRVEGVDADLVVRPFGRKGDNASIRAFDLGALQFHQGLQPVELFGEDTDPDGDGVTNEVLAGEISAMHVFAVMSERPRESRAGDDDARRRGRELFTDIGCARCHVPLIETESRYLRLSFPEVEDDPDANVYMKLRLDGGAANFRRADSGGIEVRMFSDLKRHFMGRELAESTGDELDAFFITPRLWGVADTAPYMHDGRALTLREAIELHAGEAKLEASRFRNLNDRQQRDLFEFLGSLRTPDRPNDDL